MARIMGNNNCLFLHHDTAPADNSLVFRDQFAIFFIVWVRVTSGYSQNS